MLDLPKQNMHYQTLGKYDHEIKKIIDPKPIKKIRMICKYFLILKKKEFLQKKKETYKIKYQESENLSRFSDSEWIEEVNEFFLPIAQKYNREFYRKNNSNPKNKLSSKKSRALRDRKIRNFIILPEEKELIQKFYMECPVNYDVDHIFPLSKGGEHSIKNMQWLPKYLNRKKRTKIIPALSQYPHCRLDIESII